MGNFQPDPSKLSVDTDLLEQAEGRARAKEAPLLPTKTAVFEPPETAQLAAEGPQFANEEQLAEAGERMRKLGEVSAGQTNAGLKPRAKFKPDPSKLSAPAKYGRAGIPASADIMKAKGEEDEAAEAARLHKEYVEKYGEEPAGPAAAFVGGMGQTVIPGGGEATSRIMGALPGSSVEKEKAKQQLFEREHPYALGAGRVTGLLAPNKVAQKLGELGGAAAGKLGEFAASKLISKVAPFVGRATGEALPGTVAPLLRGDLAGAAEALGIGSTLGALARTPVPKGVSPEEISAGKAFLQNRLLPGIATGARYSPLAASAASGAYQAYTDPSIAGKIEGVGTAALPIGEAALRGLLQKGGAAAITPRREAFDRQIDEAAKQWAAAQAGKVKEARAGALGEREAQAYEINKALAEAQATQAAKKKEAIEQAYAGAADIEASRSAQGAKQKEAFEQIYGTAEDIEAARKSQEAERKKALGQIEEVHGRIESAAKAQARQQVDSALEQAVGEYYDAKAKKQAEKAAAESAKGEEVSPEASATGMLRKAYGEAGTRLAHIKEAVRLQQIPDDPDLADDYRHVMETLLKNNPEALKTVRRAKEVGWDEAHKELAEKIRQKRAAAGTAAKPAPGSEAPTEPPLVKPTRAKVAATAGDVPRTPIMEDYAGALPEIPLVRPRTWGMQAREDMLPAIPEVKSRTQIMREREGLLPNLRDIQDVDVRRFVEERARQLPALAPIPSVPATESALAAARAAEMRAKAAAGKGVPGSVRDVMEKAGVPTSTSVAAQFEKEKPKFRAPVVAPSGQTRAILNEALKGVEPIAGKPLSSLLSDATPAEAEYILSRAEAARAGVDESRAAARARAVRAAVQSVLETRRQRRRRPGG